MNISACSWHTNWTEDVELKDGRMIVVKQETSRNVGIRRESWLTFTLAETGNQQVTWHGYASPMVLNVHQGKLYLVVNFDSQVEFARNGKPTPPYIGYRWEAGQWLQIPFAEIPEAIYDANLLIAIDKDGPPRKVTIAYKNGDTQKKDGTLGKHHKRIYPKHKWGERSY
jgi:hypothetical protein